MKRFSTSKLCPALLSVLVLIVMAAGCTGNTTTKKTADVSGTSAQTENAGKTVKEEPTEVNAWVALGMKNAMSEIAPLFEKENNAKLVFNFASSGDLQIQIEQGAPADVFISAAKKQITALDDKQLLVKNSIKNIARNDLIIAVPSDSKLAMSKLEDLASLSNVKKIAMGNPDQVPAGKYAIQALKKAGVWDKVEPKIIYTKDVRQISNYLDSGEVDLGLIYKSELTVVKNVKTLLLVPDSYHDPIVFSAAVVKDAEQQELGNKFVDFILEDETQKILKEYGFKPISE